EGIAIVENKRSEIIALPTDVDRFGQRHAGGFCALPHLASFLAWFSAKLMCSLLCVAKGLVRCQNRFPRGPAEPISFCMFHGVLNRTKAARNGRVLMLLMDCVLRRIGAPSRDCG